ncbi:MAG TPA: hypothetical protein VIV06_00880, partial [Candidatus Limnocylindrales bacterium]
MAARAGCHQTMISLIERGHLDRASIRLLRRVFGALDARLEPVVSWRGGDLDRLLDERHAQLVEAAASAYQRAGWDVHPEVTYARYGERGSIDLLAVRPADRAVAVNEMKSEIASVEELARRHDEKARLAAEVCFERFGWRPAVVGRVLVVPEDRTVRRVVARHALTFAAAYPVVGRGVRLWLARPTGSIGGLWFLTVKDGGRASPNAVRIRRAGSADP